MRIKNYDYETCLKLKNPMGNYKEVFNFIKDFEKEDENLIEKIFKRYNIKNFIVLNKIHCKEIIFFYAEDGSYLNDVIYAVYENEVPKIYNKELFEELKKIFLNYKLNEHLKVKLNNNNIQKKVSKI